MTATATVICTLCETKVQHRNRLRHLRSCFKSPDGRWPKETLDSVFKPWPEGRLDTWRQNNPRDQLLALVGALLGEISNINDDIQPEKALGRARRWTREIKQLGETYLQKEW